MMGLVKFAIRPTSAKPSAMIQSRKAFKWGWTLGGLLRRAWTGSDCSMISASVMVDITKGMIAVKVKLELLESGQWLMGAIRHNGH
jgi:hypothetical protein